MLMNKGLEYKILNEIEIEKIKDVSAKILEDIGCRINNNNTLKILKNAGLQVNFDTKIVKFPEEKLYEYISYATRNSYHILYGRNLNNKAEFGHWKTNIMSSSGQYMIYDWEIDDRRRPIMEDLISIAKVTKYLENIDIAGALVLPMDVNPCTREIEQEINLLNNTDKPISFWFTNGKKTRYQVEIMKVIRDGQGAIKDYPFCECFVEPISPLQFTKESMEILEVFAKDGLPIGFGPMAMQGATAPVTIAGTIVQENAEVLAGIVISQVINPGNPVTYWGIPHCMDLKTGNMSFASPEQSLLAMAMVQVARSYGFYAVGVNEGLSDSNLLDDTQNGFERGISLISGIYSKADILAHQGICGQDSCGSILQLIIDNEMLFFLKRYFNFFDVNTDTIALDLIKKVGIGGNFLVEKHTIDHFKSEIYIPKIFSRDNWGIWYKKGKKSTKDIAIERYNEIMKLEPVEPIEDEKMKEVKKILSAAKKEFSE